MNKIIGILIFSMMINGTIFAKSAFQAYTMPSTGNVAIWGPIHLDQTPAITGILPIANGGTGTSLGIVIPKNAQSAGQDLVVSANPATNALMMVRGCYDRGLSSITAGEGFTATNSGTGQTLIIFSTSFLDRPAFTSTVTSFSTTAGVAYNTLSSTSVVVVTTGSGTAQNTEFCFIAIGQRP